ncbi:ribonuclease T2 [Cladorrhinum sp. PSN332]|nr:ribonuclease T2 [Cladorrhinum sp. PSN332]
MPSSLPVPSKAALTVLRGLALGTSCTIALIVEDRRRRINNAVRVINNGDKIKSCRNYHSGKKPLGAALEQEVIVDASVFNLSRGDGGGNTVPPGRRKRKDQVEEVTEGKEDSRSSVPTPSAKNEEEDDPFAALIAAGAAAARAAPENLLLNTFELSPNSAQESKPTNPAEMVKENHLFAAPLASNVAPTENLPSNTFESQPPDPFASKENLFLSPSNDDIVARVHLACYTKDERQLVAAIRNVLDAYETNVAPDNQDAQWLNATAELCRTCQELGRIDDAAEILRRVVKHGPISQGQYAAHDPVSLLETLIEHAGSPDSDKDAYNERLDRAYQIYMAKYEVVAPDPGLYKVGAKLLEMADLANVIWRRSYRYLFQRCNNLALAAEDAGHELTGWYIIKLYEAMSYTGAIETFLWTYQRSPQGRESIGRVASIMVQCVENAGNHRADHVLKGLCKLRVECNKFFRSFRRKPFLLNSQWIIRLLDAHWKRYGNFEQTEALFHHLGPEGDLQSVVVEPESIFRVMAELALEAGDETKARSYVETAISQGLILESNVRMLGVYAKHHAKKGNWEEVRKCFDAMKVDEADPQGLWMYGRTFVPVLKAFAEQHTVHETDNFMRVYVAELNVPLNPYLVTLMANEYAKLRDVDSIVSWLDHCAHAGFQVDAGFSNAILVNIRRHWNMPFRDLRTLFRKLRELSPDFIDKSTEQFMAKAAVTASRYGGSAAIGRLLSLRLTRHKISPKVPSHIKPMNNRQLIEDMRAHIVCGRPASAWLLYRKATAEARLPYNEYVLRLALKALLQMDNHNPTRAHGLVRRLQSQGHEVTSAINYLLAVEIGDMKFDYEEAALPAVRAVLEKFQRTGLALTDESLMLAAFTCLKKNQPHAAIEYALQAAKAKGEEPCYSLRNFNVLCLAAAQLGNMRLLTEVIEKGLESDYREEGGMPLTLKAARLKLRQVRYGVDGVMPGDRSQGHVLLNSALRFVSKERKKLSDDAQRFDEEALEIMRQAALDAGQEPVDFDDIPWLGGGNNKKTPKIRDEEEEMMGGSTVPPVMGRFVRKIGC